MRLLRLKLEAFGPYSGSELIDFRALRYSRLFLVHGPVGSGKTFLLDGICFALYGRSSGGERDRRGLRYLSSATEQETVAALDFEAGNQSYRVERRIAGALEESEAPTDEVTLWRLPEIGEPTRRDILSATPSGVEQMVSKLLGLNADQFCQVAILPQGRFRRFLLADGSQRRQILSNMFNSLRYERLQNLLGSTYQEAKSELEHSWKAREDLIGQYAEQGGDPRTSLHRSQEELQAVVEGCKSHQERNTDWERSLEEAVRYEILDRQRDMSERELHALTNEQEATEDALTERLRKALPSYEKWRSLNKEAEVISAELHEQRTQFQRLKSDTNFLEEEVERARRLEEERFTLRRTIERLDELVEDYRGVNQLAGETARTQSRLDELIARRSELASQVKAAKERAAGIEEELARIEAGAKKLESLKADVERVADQRNVARQNLALEEAYSQAVQREARFKAMITEIQHERKELKASAAKKKERDIADALHVLKSEVKKGQECPLCGSLDHPKPYGSRRRRRKDIPDFELELEGLSKKLEMARHEMAQATERKARLEGRMEERAEVDAEALEVDEQTLASLRQAVVALESRVAKGEDLEKELRQIKKQSKPARTKLKKMRLLKERLTSTLESVRMQEKSRSRSVLSVARELLPECEALKARSVQDSSLAVLPKLVSDEQERLDQRLEELSEIEYSTERAELMAETFALQLAQTRGSERQRDNLQAEAEVLRLALEDDFRQDFTGWDDLSFALGRLAREQSLQGGQTDLLDRETLVRTVERQLHQSQELLATLPVPEMKAEQIRHALAREREQLEIKVGRRVALQKLIERSSEDVGRYDRLVEKIRGQEARLSELQRMSTLARGDAERMDFHEWYLDRVFRRVIEAANLRLEILAPNRFGLTLERGLEVKIVDFSAAKERSATTLSGGESFLASLALALALGDVLQSERDAKDRLQTLFIDEGFGYLDRRALEASLDCLESLKSEGRTVGIISHVKALKERIRAQIVVAPSDVPLPYGKDRIQIFAE